MLFIYTVNCGQSNLNYQLLYERVYGVYAFNVFSFFHSIRIMNERTVFIVINVTI